jgi:hypothetical protein
VPAKFVHPTPYDLHYQRTLYLPPHAPGTGGGGGGNVNFNPPGIASAQAFGAFRVAQGFIPTGIAPPASQVGPITGIQAGANGATVPGIPSGEAFGYLGTGQGIRFTSIPTAEKFGTWGAHAPDSGEYVHTLVGGPFDGQSVLIGEPVPRPLIVMTDEATGAVYDYVLDPPEQDTEPFTMLYGNTRLPDTGSDYVPVGEKGPAGATGPKGDTGPQGEPGVGYDFLWPADPLPTGWARVGDWLEFTGGTYTIGGSSVVIPNPNIAGEEPWGMRYEGTFGTPLFRVRFKGVTRWRATTNDQYLVAGIPYVFPAGATSVRYASPLISYRPADAESDTKYRVSVARVVMTPPAGGATNTITMYGGRIHADSICVGWDGIESSFAHYF